MPPPETTTQSCDTKFHFPDHSLTVLHFPHVHVCFTVFLPITHCEVQTRVPAHTRGSSFACSRRPPISRNTHHQRAPIPFVEMSSSRPTTVCSRDGALSLSTRRTTTSRNSSYSAAAARQNFHFFLAFAVQSGF